MARYWIVVDGRLKGPLEARELLREPGYCADCLVCPAERKGTRVDDWQPARNFAELGHPSPTAPRAAAAVETPPPSDVKPPAPSWEPPPATAAPAAGSESPASSGFTPFGEAAAAEAPSFQAAAPAASPFVPSADILPPVATQPAAPAPSPFSPPPPDLDAARYHAALEEKDTAVRELRSRLGQVEESARAAREEASRVQEKELAAKAKEDELRAKEEALKAKEADLEAKLQAPPPAAEPFTAMNMEAAPPPPSEPAPEPPPEPTPAPSPFVPLKAELPKSARPAPLGGGDRNDKRVVMVAFGVAASAVGYFVLRGPSKTPNAILAAGSQSPVSAAPDVTPFSPQKESEKTPPRSQETPQKPKPAREAAAPADEGLDSAVELAKGYLLSGTEESLGARLEARYPPNAGVSPWTAAKIEGEKYRVRYEPGRAAAGASSAPAFEFEVSMKTGILIGRTPEAAVVLQGDSSPEPAGRPSRAARSSPRRGRAAKRAASADEGGGMPGF